MSNAVSFLKYGDVAEFRNGLNFSKDSHGKGCKFIGVADFKDNFTPQWELLGEINPSGVARKEDYLESGDIIFVRSNGNKSLVGRSLYIDRNEKSLYSGFCIRARLKKDDFLPLFLAYYTRTNFFKSAITSVAGTNINNLNQDILGNVMIPHYSIEIQKSIVDVLSSIDEKIAINNRINAELEAMAKTLYDYWFVQFDFPDTKGKPYKTSGGKMEYNATLKREIPAGWTDSQLGNIIERSGTGLNPRDNFILGNGDNYYVTIKNVNNGKIILDDRCDKIDDVALEVIDRRSQLKAGDILFTSIEPVGVTYFIHEKPTNWNINESVFTLRPNIEKVTSEYLYLLLSSDEMKIFTKNSSSGSVHKGIRHGVLKNYTLAYSGKKIIDEFSNIMKPILRRVYFLEQENQSLTKLRDWLLPLLMNGQVTVK
ncbi:restriction endonuclease subunit S [Salmonella enterica]|nr:restriction endonuclease subunit S [Salmonella enterica]